MTISVETLAGYMADTAQMANGYSQYKVGDVTVTSNTTDTVITLGFSSKMIGYIINDSEDDSIDNSILVAFDTECGTVDKTFTIKAFNGLKNIPIGGVQSIHLRNVKAEQSNTVRYFAIG